VYDIHAVPHDSHIGRRVKGNTHYTMHGIHQLAGSRQIAKLPS
jgi:hypothetical protein